MIKWCNDQGGINGREVVGNYYDAKILDVNTAMQEACNTFMLVGQGWALDGSAEETRLNCNLATHPGSPFAAYEAAQVFALAGERNSALVRVEEALESGLAPEWFRVPPFDGLAGDADFEGKLRGFTASGAADR